jgi:hypothetical protein
MRRWAVSFALAGLLATSLAGKSLGLSSVNDTERDSGAAAVAFLKTHGLDMAPLDYSSAPVWVIGARGGCVVRIAEVAPEGWARSIVAEQTVGYRLVYAFNGHFYDEQPVMRTKIENYRRRLVRYAGFQTPSLQLLAIAVSSTCPSDILRPEDAVLLSR